MTNEEVLNSLEDQIRRLISDLDRHTRKKIYYTTVVNSETLILAKLREEYDDLVEEVSNADYRD